MDMVEAQSEEHGKKNYSFDRVFPPTVINFFDLVAYQFFDIISVVLCQPRLKIH